MSGIDGSMAALIDTIIHLQVRAEGPHLQPHGCYELFDVQVCMDMEFMQGEKL